ncbi:MAG TPA: site-2 protease family protein [Bryobacteraceae bacterium]|jgi:Zn-dependent protease|nr:site-2 protease family protein [Bryobacteraceae bacterium]
MRWSWKIGRIAGIDLYVHATFFLLILWVVVLHAVQGRSIQAVLSGVGFIVALFACVVLHEFGHALAARRFGIPTKDITLLPIGGVSRFERMPEKPWQEFWVAAAGPLVSLATGVVIYLALFLAAGFQPLTGLSITSGPFLERLLVANVALAIFNLIPAFPMDGGRVLRALLATRMDHVRATQIAASVGQGLALIFGLFGLFRDPFLLFIAFFVWIGAAAEAHSVQMKDAFSGIPIRAAMQTNFTTLTTEQTLADAVRMILAGSQHDFPVMWGDRVMGILTKSNLLSGLTQYGPDQPVTTAIEREFQTAEPNEMLEAVLTRLATAPARVIPVLENGSLVGLVTAENLGEYLMIQNALHRRQFAVRATGGAAR